MNQPDEPASEMTVRAKMALDITCACLSREAISPNELAENIRDICIVTDTLLARLNMTEADVPIVPIDLKKDSYASRVIADYHRRRREKAERLADKLREIRGFHSIHCNALVHDEKIILTQAADALDADALDAKLSEESHP